MAEIEFDPLKRAETLKRRKLDFADAVLVFEGETVTVPSPQTEHDEPRFLTAGFLRSRLVILVWTPRGAARRIISMRRSRGREAKDWHHRLGGP